MLYLLGEIAMLLVLAAILGVATAYLRWGRGTSAVAKPDEQLRTKVRTLQSQLAEATATVETRSAEIRSALETIWEADEGRRALTSELAESRGSSSGEVERLQSRLSNATAALDDKATTITLLEGRIPRLEGDGEARVAELEAALGWANREKDERQAELKAAAGIIAEVEAERVKEAAAAAALQVEKDRAEADLEDAARLARESTNRLAELEAQLASAPVRVPDDLEEIAGIGPKLSAVLKEVGLEGYEQLATLGDNGIANLNGPLVRFQRRMISEDWVGQAQRLQRIKYGRA